MSCLEKYKCNTCLYKYEGRHITPCNKCRWNTEDYFGKKESDLVEDRYRYVKEDEELSF